MKTSHDIWNKAQNSSRTYNNRSAIENGNYNTDFMLSHEHVKAAALLLIADKNKITFDQAVKSCFIDGISVQNTQNLSQEDIKQFFSETVGNAIANTKKNAPSFLVVDDSTHFILISLLPTNKPNEVSIIYNNSIPAGKTCRHFAEALVTYLKNTGISVRDDKYIDMSQDQQLDNCCGLSVASNISAIVSNFHAINKNINTLSQFLFKPANQKEKQTYYQDLGYSFFQKLDDKSFSMGHNTVSYDMNEPELAELILKYKHQLKTMTVSKTQDKVISDIFTEAKNRLTLLDINECKAPANTFLPSVNGKTKLSYAQIGENHNSLIMAETEDNKIYFDEGNNNKFTGLVFIQRSDPKTGSLLESKDMILYKNGKVIDFYEGSQGMSRLGQLTNLQATKIGRDVSPLYNGIKVASSSHNIQPFQPQKEAVMAK